MVPAYHCSAIDPRWRADVGAVAPSVPREGLPLDPPLAFSTMIDAPTMLRQTYTGFCEIPGCTVCSGEMARRGS